jgi:hypothetical protein
VRRFVSLKIPKPEIPGLKTYKLKRVKPCEVCGERSIHCFYHIEKKRIFIACSEKHAIRVKNFIESMLTSQGRLEKDKGGGKENGFVCGNNMSRLQKRPCFGYMRL